MSLIDLSIDIAASQQRCFDLSRDIDLHLKSMSQTGEVAIAGKKSGLIGYGEEVTWEGRHFGIRLRHTARITGFNPPGHFQDSMVKGAFAEFVHDHHFVSVAPTLTKMRDVVRFHSPLGFVGRMVDSIILQKYIRSLIAIRQLVIKTQAETSDA